MPKINTDKPLPDPILSLLVAADQCCPAIIGQAHLLYYSGGGINRGQAAKTCAQLGQARDALSKAVASVEAAMVRGRM